GGISGTATLREAQDNEYGEGINSQCSEVDSREDTQAPPCARCRRLQDIVVHRCSSSGRRVWEGGARIFLSSRVLVSASGRPWPGLVVATVGGTMAVSRRAWPLPGRRVAGEPGSRFESQGWMKGGSWTPRLVATGDHGESPAALPERPCCA